MSFFAAYPPQDNGTSGTVTSVGLSAPGSIFTVSGSPVTTSGTLALTLVNQSANTVFAGPASGGSAAPTFRALVLADLPAGIVTTIGVIDSQVASANGAVIASNSLVMQSASATVPGLVNNTTQTLSGAKTFSSGLTVTAYSTAGVLVNDASGVITTSATLSIAKGGTGQATASAAFDALSPLTTKGDIIGYSTTNARVPIGTDGQVLTADSAQTLGLKWATPTTGTVTSVALTVPAFLSVSGSPITTSGTLAVTLSGTALPVANGGTGQTTLTDHGVLIGAGTSAITQLAAAAAGTLLTGQGAASNPSFSSTPTLGIAGTTKGTISLSGNTSGTITIQSQAGAGTYNFNLPTDAGTNGQALISQGGGAAAMTFSTLPFAGGGTNQTSWSASTIARVNAGATALESTPQSANQVLISTAGNVPTFSSTLPTAVQGNITSVGTITSGTWTGTTIAIANGGTGQTTASSAFGALSPLTTKGDVLGYSTVNARIPIGTDGQILTADSTQTLGLKWAAPATSGTVTSVALTVPAFLSVAGSPITSSGTLAITLSGTALPIANGGTAATTANAAYNNLSPMTTLGDMEYEDATPVAVRLAGNTTSTKKFLTQTGNGTISAAPGWNTIIAGDVPTLNQNTTGSAGTLSPGRTINGTLFDGSTNITVTAAAGTLTGTTLNSSVVSSSLTSVGTITSGTWTGTTIAIANGGTGQTTASTAFGALSPLTTKGDLLTYSTVNARLPVGTDGQVLSADSTQTTGLKWSSASAGTVTSVALTVPAFLSVAGSPVTTSGTLAVTLSGTALPIANGGTGATTAQAAYSNLTPNVTQVTTTYSTLATDSYIVCDMSGSSNASYTLTLLTAVGHTGLTQTITTSTGTGVLTINTTSSQTIGGFASGVIKFALKRDKLTIFSDGTNWIIADWDITVSALYTGNPPTGTLTNAFNKTTFGTKVNDTFSAYSTGTYTVPITGTYSIYSQTGHSATYVAANTASIAIYINGVRTYDGNVSAGGVNGSLYPTISIHSVELGVGDTIEIYSFDDGTSPSFTSSARQNYFSIVRTGN